jgi:hypothetical protein
MPNDAKLGLVLGVGVVLAVALIFFRQDNPAGAGQVGRSAGAAVLLPAPAELPAAAPRVNRAGG